MILSQSQHKTCSVQSAVWYNDAILQPEHLQQRIDLTSPVLVVLASTWAVGAARGVKPTRLIKHLATAGFTWLPCWVYARLTWLTLPNTAYLQSRSARQFCCWTLVHMSLAASWSSERNRGQTEPERDNGTWWQMTGGRRGDENSSEEQVNRPWDTRWTSSRSQDPSALRWHHRASHLAAWRKMEIILSIGNISIGKGFRVHHITLITNMRYTGGLTCTTLSLVLIPLLFLSKFRS